MTWTSFHHRGEILRSVIRAADLRRDGLLPLDVEGVAETFADELELLGALQLRWHTRLSGRIERELAHQPMDLEAAVAVAWRTVADELPGVRALVDHYREHPVDEAMALALAKATRKEHALLAVMAGRGSVHDARSAAMAEEVGARIEERARAMASAAPRAVEAAAARSSLLDRLGRLKAALAA